MAAAFDRTENIFCRRWCDDLVAFTAPLRDRGDIVFCNRKASDSLWQVLVATSTTVASVGYLSNRVQENDAVGGGVTYIGRIVNRAIPVAGAIQAFRIDSPP
jgi:hypothetical protein